jgi:hypothetical protein
MKRRLKSKPGRAMPENTASKPATRILFLPANLFFPGIHPTFTELTL